MYAWLSARLPRGFVNAIYLVWYVILILLIAYCYDQKFTDFYYLHG